MSRRTHQSEVLGEVWGALLQHRWRFAVAAFLTCALVLGVSLLLPRRYKAEAVFERRTDMVLSEIINHGAPPNIQEPKQAMKEEITGQPAVEEMLQALRNSAAMREALGSRIRDLDRLRGEVSRLVTVNYDVSTNEVDRVRVSYIGQDPVLARAVVNTLVEAYLARARARLEARLKQSVGFCKDEVKRNAALIEELENKKLAFEIEHAGLLPDGGGRHSAATDLQSRRLEAQQQRDSAQARIEALQRSLENTSATTPSVVTGRNPELTQLEAKLRELQGQLAQAVGVLKMKDKHPDVQVLREQVTLLEQKIAQTPPEVVTERHVSDNPRRADLELRLATAQTELTALDNHLRALQSQADEIGAQSAKLFPVRSDYLKLCRQVDEARRQLAFWEDNVRPMELMLTAETGSRGVQFELLKPCEELRRPVSPDLFQVLAAAAALGLLAGGLGVFFAHRADEAFHSGDQLAKTFELPMFGSVSEIISRRQRRLRRLRQAVLYPVHGLVMACVLAALAGLLYLNLEKPDLYDQFRARPMQFLGQHLKGSDPAGGNQE